MQMDGPGRPLQKVLREALPVPEAGQVLIKVHACGVCRTDLHIVDGDLPYPGRPVVPGHEVVGTVMALGSGVRGVQVG
ncbi:alcohol dehydrogenase catalytic domain-containing protein, partial [Salinisphaera sp. USBA-960]|nr:alcohol dehydrogenase catalytic domain-containing protein [Salifodinibacter halophilus]